MQVQTGGFWCGWEVFLCGYQSSRWRLLLASYPGLPLPFPWYNAWNLTKQFFTPAFYQGREEEGLGTRLRLLYNTNLESSIEDLATVKLIIYVDAKLRKSSKNFVQWRDEENGNIIFPSRISPITLHAMLSRWCVGTEFHVWIRCRQFHKVVFGR